MTKDTVYKPGDRPPAPYEFTSEDWGAGEFEAAVLYPAEEADEKWSKTLWGTPDTWHLPNLWPTPAEYLRLREAEEATGIRLHGEPYRKHLEVLRAEEVKAAVLWMAKGWEAERRRGVGGI